MNTAEAATQDWSEALEHPETLDTIMAIATKMYELNVGLGYLPQIHVMVNTDISSLLPRGLQPPFAIWHACRVSQHARR